LSSFEQLAAMTPRNLVAAGTAVIAIAGLVALPPFDWLRGISLDVMFALRHATMGVRHAPAQSPTVVVAIDEETYRRPPFRDLPKVMWTKQIASVITAVIDGGAKVMGFDVIYPTSVERYMRGFDREFLIALRLASRKGKIVLSKVQHQAKPISPFPGYSFAVGHQKNIRAANAYEDDDGVIRRMSLLFRGTDAKKGERIETSLALELAACAIGQRPGLRPDGGVTLGGYDVPASRDGTMVVNFEGGSGNIPTYSLADLVACADKGKTDYFAKHFGGKVVLVGVVVDVEDRRLTSKRFATGPEGVGIPERCVVPVPKGLYRHDIARDTIPGVYIHAAAVNDLMRHDALRELGTISRSLVDLAIAAAAAAAVMLLSPLVAGIAVAAAAILWAGAATAAMQGGLILPMLHPLVAALLTFVALIGYRFAVADKDKRYLRRSFALYLPPTVVDKLVEGHAPPALGGETRELSAFFSDIAGFTSISEGLSPEELVTFLNKYLSVMTDTIEEHGGFVDKYIGDAVVGVFGAPLADPDHALHAVQAALACQQRLGEMQNAFGLPGNPVVGTRIGICSGDLLVGNIGSGRRFNYTIMGDTANLASRLEGANKVYGTPILVGDRTIELAGDAMVSRELDLIRVVGRDAPERVYEPIAPPGELSSETRERLARFAEALDHYRARRFNEAEKMFAALADADPASRLYVERARLFAEAPPPDDWSGVTDLQEK